MKKAFIFDMDGVLIDCESEWKTFKHTYFQQQLGADVAQRMDLTIGMTMDLIYEKARSLGARINREQFKQGFLREAPQIYSNANIPDGVDRLVQELINKRFRIGMVSNSPSEWMAILRNRLTFGSNIINVMVSLNDRTDLHPKPAPDGYFEAMKQLNVTPQDTIILEDSNKGIQSAKASGAYTIAFREFLLPGYKQDGADTYADTIEDVIKIVEAL